MVASDRADRALRRPHDRRVDARDRRSSSSRTRHSVQYMCSIPNVRRMSTSFQSAGAAGVNYFDTLLVEPSRRARRSRTREPRSRSPSPTTWSRSCSSTLAHTARSTISRPRGAKHSLAWGLLSLAGSELAYYDAAEPDREVLLARRPHRRQRQGRDVEHDKAFTTCSRPPSAARARARGPRGSRPARSRCRPSSPTSSRRSSATATSATSSTRSSEFWAASAFSQTAVMLARN